MRVGIIQFLKPNTANFGELRAARKLGIEVTGTGDGWTWRSKDLDQSAALAVHGWELARQRITQRRLRSAGAGRVHLSAALRLARSRLMRWPGWLSTSQTMLHVVITGRYAPRPLIDAADLVTEMRLVKHPFEDQGIRAQPGIEF